MSTKITDHMLKGTSIRTLLQRAAAEAGFNLVDGSFEEGAVVTESNDVVWFRNEGTYYGWGGTIPVGGYIVPAGSTPATTGGIGVGAWVDRTDMTLRSDINIVQKRFACVADMIADTSLTVGKIVETIGYYDGWVTTSDAPKGGNRYEIVNSGIGVSDSGSFILLNNGLLAKGLFPNGRISVAQFGSRGAATGVENRLAIQKAVNYASISDVRCLDFEHEDYVISPNINHAIWFYNIDGLTIRGNGATIKFTSGRAFNVLDSKNITIHGFTFDPTGGGNCGIVVHCSSNGSGLNIESETWTDGLYGVDDYRTENIDIYCCTVKSGTLLAGMYIGFSHDGYKDTGVTAGLVRNILIDKCDISGSEYHGVSTSFTNTVKVTRSTFSDNKWYCVNFSNSTLNGIIDKCKAYNTKYFCKVQSSYSRDGSGNPPVGVTINIGCKITNNFVVQSNLDKGVDLVWVILDTGSRTVIENNIIDFKSDYCMYLQGNNGTVSKNKIAANHNNTWTGRVFSIYKAAWDTLGTNAAIRLGGNYYSVSENTFEGNNVAGNHAICGGYQLYSDDRFSLVNNTFSGRISEFIYVNSAGENNQSSGVSLINNSGTSTLAMNFILFSLSTASVMTVKNYKITGNLLNGLNTLIQSSAYIYYKDIIIDNNIISMGSGGSRLFVNFYDGGRIDKVVINCNKIYFNSTSTSIVIQTTICTQCIITSNILESGAAIKSVCTLVGSSVASVENLFASNIHKGFDLTSFIGTVGDNQISTF